MVLRRRMVPEEYKASRSAMSFARCAGFLNRGNGATVLISPEEMEPSCTKEPWTTTTNRRIKQDMRRILILHHYAR
jgi:hypothetical protein